MSYPYLVIGQKLEQNQFVYSPAHTWKLWQQSDGNLVLYNGANEPKWQANTATGAGNFTILQADGNFCVYTSDGTPMWAAQSNQSNFNGILIVTDDGKILIEDFSKDVTAVPMRA